MQRLGLWVLCSRTYRDDFPPSTASWPPLQPGRHRGLRALAPCPRCFSISTRTCRLAQGFQPPGARTAHPLPGPERAGDPPPGCSSGPHNRMPSASSRRNPLSSRVFRPHKIYPFQHDLPGRSTPVDSIRLQPSSAVLSPAAGDEALSVSPRSPSASHPRPPTHCCWLAVSGSRPGVSSSAQRYCL
ncbi:unnamed protein product [Rangifer tarandus platyrhynchus]|uniref:Uncharacterized protein n=1 Tax=Rangifer tarandus platyrhynchus TaxID=3082113 RepID=A0AC60A963_RANTA